MSKMLPNLIEHSLVPIACLVMVLALIPLVRRLAISLKFVDVPGGRKKHEGHVPPVGGLVIFPVFMIGCVMAGMDMDTYAPLFAAIALLLTVGSWDDRFGVPAWTKFAVQFVAAFLIVIPGQTQISALGNLLGYGPIWLGILTIPFSVIATVLLINAINLIDGLDGLSGGIGFVCLVFLAVMMVMAESIDHLAPVLIMLACLAGFLFYNMRHPWRKSAAVFIGDAGSLSLGLILAWFFIRHAGGGSEKVIHPITVAWILGLPIMDICGQFARRMSQGKHPFTPDHHHFHHHFVTAGLGTGQSVMRILAIVIIYGLIGVVGMIIAVPETILAYIWILLILLHIFLSLRPHRMRRVILTLFGSK